eukprot:scaffold304217_cov45-Prasinocladus_malaysianus.AAC.1
MVVVAERLPSTAGANAGRPSSHSVALSALCPACQRHRERSMTSLRAGATRRCLSARGSARGGGQLDRRAAVHVLKVPLVGLETITTMMGTLYPQQLKHCMTAIQTPEGEVRLPKESIWPSRERSTLSIKSNSAASQQCWTFDFLPADPTSAETLSNMLAGKAVPGMDTRIYWQYTMYEPCHFCSHYVDELVLRTFNPNIRLFSNDCRHHTSQLVKLLTGKQ